MSQPREKPGCETRAHANDSARAVKLLRRLPRNYNPPGLRYTRFNRQRTESMSVTGQCFAIRNATPDFAL